MPARTFALLFVILFLFTGCTVSGDKLVRRIDRIMEKTAGYYAELDAVVFSLEGEQTYRVKQWLQNPDRWRVEVNTGNSSQVFICDGQHIWVYQPGINDHYRLEIGVGTRELAPPFMLTGYLQNLRAAKDFTYEGVQEVNGKKTYLISYPGSLEEESVRLFLDTKKLFPLVVETYLGEDLLSRVTTVSCEMNPKFDDGLFQFTGEPEKEVAAHCLIKPLSLDEARDEWSAPIYLPAYTPDGSWLFVVSRGEEEGLEQLILIYEGEQPFTLIQRAKADRAVYRSTATTDIKIGGETGVYQKNNRNNLITLWWSNQECDFVLTGAIPLTELMQIASSLQRDGS